VHDRSVQIDQKDIGAACRSKQGQPGTRTRDIEPAETDATPPNGILIDALPAGRLAGRDERRLGCVRNRPRQGRARTDRSAHRRGDKSTPRDP
jgi:hypothetical protein